MNQTKFILSEKEMPTSWYNILPDLPKPLPPLLHPGTKEPTILPPPLFASALRDQEFSQERYIEIPEDLAISLQDYSGGTLIEERNQEGEILYWLYEINGVSDE